MRKRKNRFLFEKGKAEGGGIRREKKGAAR